MYLVVSKLRPGIVQTANPPRQLLLADAIKAATGYLFYTTSTYCRPGDALPADAVPFYGEAVAVVDKSGAVTIGAGTVAQAVKTVRMESYTTAGCDASSLVTLTFPTPFSAPPEVLPKRTVNALTSVEGQVVSKSATAVTLKVFKQVLSGGVLAAAPAGTACDILVLGS